MSVAANAKPIISQRRRTGVAESPGTISTARADGSGRAEFEGGAEKDIVRGEARVNDITTSEAVVWQGAMIV